MCVSVCVRALLFGKLVKTRPRHGIKKRWRDLAVMDVRTLRIEGDWFTNAQNRRLLFTVPVEGLSVGKRALPGTQVFARLFNPDYWFTSQLIREELPPNNHLWMGSYRPCVRMRACGCRPLHSRPGNTLQASYVLGF